MTNSQPGTGHPQVPLQTVHFAPAENMQGVMEPLDLKQPVRGRP